MKTDISIKKIGKITKFEIFEKKRKNNEKWKFWKKIKSNENWKFWKKKTNKWKVKSSC